MAFADHKAPVEITVDPVEWARVQETLDEFPKEIPKVLAKAMNAAGRTMRARVARVVKTELGIKIGVIKKRVWQTKATKTKLVARIVGGKIGWPVGAVAKKFRADPNGLEIRFGSKRMYVKGAFEATMPTGYQSGWIRFGRKRLPIEEIRTESVTGGIEKAAGLPEVLRAGTETLNKRLRAETDRTLARILKRKGRAA